MAKHIFVVILLLALPGILPEWNKAGLRTRMIIKEM